MRLCAIASFLLCLITLSFALPYESPLRVHGLQVIEKTASASPSVHGIVADEANPILYQAITHQKRRHHKRKQLKPRGLTLFEDWESQDIDIEGMFNA